MQKVVGSSPIIRSQKPVKRGFFVGAVAVRAVLRERGTRRRLSNRGSTVGNDSRRRGGPPSPASHPKGVRMNKFLAAAALAAIAAALAVALGGRSEANASTAGDPRI